jgi:hemolysin type calcium-binding protein
MVSPRADRRLAGAVLALAAAVLALAGSAWTQTDRASRSGKLIRGTNGNDVLRGTSGSDILEGLAGNDRLYGGRGADRLYGSAGNDQLFGGPGDDLLAGGPGTDRFSCGPGRDVVYASRSSTVARDCEVVHRSGSGPPGIATGLYHGDAVSFRLSADAKSVSSLQVDFKGSCNGASTQIQIASSGPWAVQPDHTFSIAETESDGDTLNLSGQIENGAVAHGTFEVRATIGGDMCDTGSVSWTARRS